MSFNVVTMKADGSLRKATLDGKTYIVAPLVGMTEGVRNQFMVLASEFERSIPGWNGRPVVLRHPTESGAPISANSPEVFERQWIGLLFNSVMTGKKFKTEAWIDAEKVVRLGGDTVKTVERVLGGDRVEVSTGYFADVEKKKGTYGNQAYQAIHHNIIPDHLAFLVEEEGACNWRDGCGVPRINNTQEVQGKEVSLDASKLKQTVAYLAGMAGVDLGFPREPEIKTTAPEEEPSLEVSESDSVEGDEQETQITDNTADSDSVSEEPEPALANFNSAEDQTNMKSTLVDALIAHESTPWGEGCRAKLEAFDEAMLEQMLASFESSEPDQEESTADDTPEPEVNAQDEAQTSREVQEFINRLIPKETLEFIETQNSRAKQHRQTLEQGVKTRYGLSESSIAAMSLADLESLASSMPVVNYSGKGAPVMAHVEEDENPPPPVVMRERKVPDGN